LYATEEFKSSNIVLEKLYRRALEDFKEHLKDATNPSIIYVTDLVSCSQKREFRLKYPELTFKFEPSHILGSMVHLGLEEVLKEEGYDVEVEFEKDVTIDSRKIKVKGRVDAINENYIIEIKTARSDLGLPHEHHLMQLQIYLNAFNRKAGILIYITPDRLAEYYVERKPLDLESLIAEVMYNSVHPRWNWECRYCPFAKMCPYRIVEK